MKVILDCNVIISAGLTDGVCRRVVRHTLAHHVLYVSDEILTEYKDVISRPRFQTSYEYLRALIEIICECAEFVESEKLDFILPDQDDIIYIEAALTAAADYLVTGNLKDFPQVQYGNTTIFTPAEFLSVSERAYS